MSRTRTVLGWPWRQAQNAASRATFARGQIDTSRKVELGEVGFEGPGRGEYIPSGWFFARRMLRGCAITRDDVFVDLGSGKGRMVCMAARYYPFGRVIGVEIVPAFNAVARENIERMRPRLTCQHVELITSDVTTWRVPDDLTYAYMFNPFGAELVEAVLANICSSLERRPRPLTLLYAHPAHADVVLATGRFERIRTTRGIRRDIPLYRIDVFAATG